MSIVTTQGYMPQGNLSSWEDYDNSHSEAKHSVRNDYGYQPATGHTFHWMMAAGVVSIVSGVALAIIGALCFSFGDVAGGIWATISAVSGITIGIAVIGFDFWLFH